MSLRKWPQGKELLSVQSAVTFAKQIRNEELLKDMFLIALSGYAGYNDIEHAKESGFNLHLSKPIDIEVIKKVLNEIPIK